MQKYNKIYFLHIPKTGGRFFTEYILKPIEEVLKKNNIEIIQLPPNVSKHGGWHNDIDDQTYIVSIFREPSEFFISVIAHMIADQANMIDPDKDHIIKDNTKILDISKDLVHKKIEEMHYIDNFQSQNFILSPTQNHIIQESMRLHRENKGFDEDLINQRVQRVNLMIRHKDFKSMDYSLLIKKIFLDLGIEETIQLKEADREHYKNNSSENLFNKLNSEDIQAIHNKFLFDKKIYEDDSLFWAAK